MRAVFKAASLILAQQLSVQLAYRMAFIQVALFEAVGLAGTLFYWRAAAGGASGSTSGYSVASIVVYFIVASSHQILQESGISRSLSMDIRTGKMAAALVRPFPFLLQPIAQGIAFSLSRFIMIGPVLIVIFTLTPGLRDFFADIARQQGMFVWLASYLITLGLALVCNLVLRLSIGLLAFDMTQTWGPELLLMALFFALSGVVYPVDLLPPRAVEMLSWTPFFYLQGLPNLVAIGRISDSALTTYLARGCLVTAVLAVLLGSMWRRGVRKFEATGI